MRDEGLFGAGTPRTTFLKKSLTQPITAQEIRALRKKKILFFGDSNMFGQSHIPDKFFIKDVRYKQRYPTYFMDAYDVVESALCSRTTSIDATDADWVSQSVKDPKIFNGSDTFPFMLEVHRPNIVVLSLGTNDTRKTNRDKLGFHPETPAVDFAREITGRVLKMAKDAIETHNIEHVYVLSPPHIRLEKHWGGTESMGYDEKSVLICAAFQQAFEDIFVTEQHDVLTHIPLSEVLSLADLRDKEAVGRDGVHISEMANFEIAKTLGQKHLTNANSKRWEKPPPCFERDSNAWVRLTCNNVPTFTTPDIVFYGNTPLNPDEKNLIVANFGKDVRFVEHINASVTDLIAWEQHFHSVFSQHSAQWLFLLFPNDDAGRDLKYHLAAHAITMVTEHPRYRHVALGSNMGTLPCDQKNGLQIYVGDESLDCTNETQVKQHLKDSDCYEFRYTIVKHSTLLVQHSFFRRVNEVVDFSNNTGRPLLKRSRTQMNT